MKKLLRAIDCLLHQEVRSCILSNKFKNAFFIAGLSHISQTQLNRTVKPSTKSDQQEEEPKQLNPRDPGKPEVIVFLNNSIHRLNYTTLWATKNIRRQFPDVKVAYQHLQMEYYALQKQRDELTQQIHIQSLTIMHLKQQASFGDRKGRKKSDEQKNGELREANEKLKSEAGKLYETVNDRQKEITWWKMKAEIWRQRYFNFKFFSRKASIVRHVLNSERRKENELPVANDVKNDGKVRDLQKEVYWWKLKAVEWRKKYTRALGKLKQTEDETISRSNSSLSLKKCVGLLTRYLPDINITDLFKADSRDKISIDAKTYFSKVVAPVKVVRDRVRDGWFIFGKKVDSTWNKLKQNWAKSKYTDYTPKSTEGTKIPLTWQRFRKVFAMSNLVSNFKKWKSQAKQRYTDSKKNEKDEEDDVDYCDIKASATNSGSAEYFKTSSHVAPQVSYPHAEKRIATAPTVTFPEPSSEVVEKFGEPEDSEASVRSDGGISKLWQFDKTHRIMEEKLRKQSNKRRQQKDLLKETIEKFQGKQQGLRRTRELLERKLREQSNKIRQSKHELKKTEQWRLEIAEALKDFDNQRTEEKEELKKKLERFEKKLRDHSNKKRREVNILKEEANKVHESVAKAAKKQEQLRDGYENKLRANSNKIRNEKRKLKEKSKSLERKIAKAERKREKLQTKNDLLEDRLRKQSNKRREESNVMKETAEKLKNEIRYAREKLKIEEYEFRRWKIQEKARMQGEMLKKWEEYNRVFREWEEKKQDRDQKLSQKVNNIKKKLRRKERKLREKKDRMHREITEKWEEYNREKRKWKQGRKTVEKKMDEKVDKLKRKLKEKEEKVKGTVYRLKTALTKLIKEDHEKFQELENTKKELNEAKNRLKQLQVYFHFVLEHEKDKRSKVKQLYKTTNRKLNELEGAYKELEDKFNRVKNRLARQYYTGISATEHPLPKLKYPSVFCPDQKYCQRETEESEDKPYLVFCPRKDYCNAKDKEDGVRAEEKQANSKTEGKRIFSPLRPVDYFEGRKCSYPDLKTRGKKQADSDTTADPTVYVTFAKPKEQSSESKKKTPVSPAKLSNVDPFYLLDINKVKREVSTRNKGNGPLAPPKFNYLSPFFVFDITKLGNKSADTEPVKKPGQQQSSKPKGSEWYFGMMDERAKQRALPLSWYLYWAKGREQLRREFEMNKAAQNWYLKLMKEREHQRQEGQKGYYKWMKSHEEKRAMNKNSWIMERARGREEARQREGYHYCW